MCPCLCGWVCVEKSVLALLYPTPRPDALPGPVGAWSGMGRRRSVLSSPPCLRSSVSSSCLYLVLVAVLLHGPLGVPAFWFPAAAVAVRCCLLASLWGCTGPGLLPKVRAGSAVCLPAALFLLLPFAPLLGCVPEPRAGAEQCNIEKGNATLPVRHQIKRATLPVVLFAPGQNRHKRDLL